MPALLRHSGYAKATPASAAWYEAREAERPYRMLKMNHGLDDPCLGPEPPIEVSDHFFVIDLMRDEGARRK